MQTGCIKKHLTSPLFYLFLIITGYIGFTRITDGDIGYHLAQGKYFFENNYHLPIKEVFSYTIFGGTNIIISWLFDVLIYSVYLKAGIIGLSLWKSVLLALLGALFIFRLEGLINRDKIHSSKLYTYSAAFLFLSAVYKWANIERPHALAYIYFSIFLLVYSYFLKGTKKHHWLALFIIQLLWANSHGSFVFGIFIALAGLAGLGARKTGLLLLLLIGASLINPFGYNIFLNSLKAAPSGVYRYIQELWPMRLEDFISLTGVFWCLSVIPIYNFWKQRDFKMLIIFLGFASLGLNSARFAYDYVILTAPFTIAGIISRLPLSSKKPAIAFNFIFFVFSLWAFVLMSSEKVHGAGFSKNDLPVKACEFIVKKNLQGNMFNSFGLGSYLIWELYPERRVFIDTRGQNYIRRLNNDDNEPFLVSYYGILGNNESWKEMDKKYNFNYAVVDWPFLYKDRIINYTGQNLNPEEWAPVFFDAKAIIYLKRNESNKALIDANEYKFIRPQEIDPIYFQEYLKDPFQWLMCLNEFKRALTENPDNYRMHFLYASFLFQNSASDEEEIIEHLKESLRLNPKFPQAKRVLKTVFNIIE